MHTRRFLLRRGAILSIAASLTLASAWASSQNESLPNFQKVDDHVYRGAQPTNNGFETLAKRGIKTVVDLRDIGEHSQADEQKAVTDLGMRYVSIPMQVAFRGEPEQYSGMKVNTDSRMKPNIFRPIPEPRSA